MATNPPPPPGDPQFPGGQPPPPPGGPPPPPGYPPAPGAPPPGYVPFGAPPGGPSGQRTNGLAVASLVLGILGIVLCFLWLPWILAITFGAIAIRQCNNDPSYTGKGLAIAGLVCGLVGGGIILLFLISSGGDFTYDFNSMPAGFGVA